MASSLIAICLSLEDKNKKQNVEMENTNTTTQENNTKVAEVKVKTYKRRWVILVIYIFYSAANSFQWMEYSIIANIVKKYYHVSSIAVDWTSVIYMAIYPIIVVPVSFVIEKKGLRMAALVGGIGTALAAVVKVFSIGPDLFYVVLIGQAIGSTAQVFVLCLPSKIAAVWFKSNEVSTACSLAVVGTQMGFALGFVIPSSVVRNHENAISVASDLRKLCWILTIYMLPVVTAIIFYFAKLPPLPPSDTQLEERKKNSPTFKEYFSSFKKLFHNYGFVVHTIAYGINIGVFAAIGTFLNQFILFYFPHCEEDAGRIGLLMVVGGMVGSVLFGTYLDKTHKYKETTLFIYIMSVLSILASILALELKTKSLVYVAFCIVGIFTNAYMPVGFEFAVELTFPADESTTTGVLNAATQAVGVATTLALGPLQAWAGPKWALASQALLLAAGAGLTAIVPDKKKRQEAEQRAKDGRLMEGG